MNEDFLHYIWKFRLFDSNSLATSDGENIELIKPGEHNTDSGPDFQNARIKIGNTTWAGNIEIHLNSSDWIKHKHHEDKAYDNIILHVVYNNDLNINRSNNENIPVIELKKLIPGGVYRKYINFINSNQWIPCENSIKQVDSLIISSWLDRILVERLEKKADTINQTLQLYKNDWEHTFYIHLARNFGFKLNAEAFEMLAKSTSLSYLAKHKTNLFQLEAILFGQAGMLTKSMREEYPSMLFQEYCVLKQKFSLSAIDGHLWKFLRLHPAGFPTIRIAQFATLIQSSVHLFSKIIEAKKLTEIEDLFNVECSDYWQNHYVFGKESPKRSKKFGKPSIDNIVINTIVPFLFVYGINKNDGKYKDRAVKFLEQLEGEKNNIISKWKLLDVPTKTAFSTQSLLELKNNYCKNKKCLSCGIGNFLLRKAK
ncbi:MAG: DUF2851 family protein [Bacteroidetes bacterium]|nr:DUF2851 family protein [Bacteroidota bacterium]